MHADSHSVQNLRQPSSGQFGQSFQNVGWALTFNVVPHFDYHETLTSFLEAVRSADEAWRLGRHESREEDSQYRLDD